MRTSLAIKIDQWISNWPASLTSATETMTRVSYTTLSWPQHPANEVVILGCCCDFLPTDHMMSLLQKLGFCIMLTCGPLGLAGLSLLLHRAMQLSRGKKEEAINAAPLAAWVRIKSHNLCVEKCPYLPLLMQGSMRLLQDSYKDAVWSTWITDPVVNSTYDTKPSNMVNRQGFWLSSVSNIWWQWLYVVYGSNLDKNNILGNQTILSKLVGIQVYLTAIQVYKHYNLAYQCWLGNHILSHIAQSNNTNKPPTPTC
jgi:hypothetical protein